jgi:hypothetical protein
VIPCRPRIQPRPVPITSREDELKKLNNDPANCVDDPGMLALADLVRAVAAGTHADHDGTALA